MTLLKAILRARRASRKTGACYFIVHDGRTWDAVDECELDTRYPEAWAVLSVGGRR